MDATEAWQHTSTNLDRMIAEDIEVARLAEIAEQEHQNLINGLVEELHERIDKQIDAIEDATQTIKFSHTEPKAAGQSPTDEEQDNWMNIREANGLLIDRLKGEGFDVLPSGINEEGFTGHMWNRYTHHMTISWEAPKPKNAFHKFLDGIVKRP